MVGKQLVDGSVSLWCGGGIVREKYVGGRAEVL